MERNNTIKLKVAALLGLSLLAVFAALSYFRTFDTERDAKQLAADINERMEKLHTLPLPVGVTKVVQDRNGSPEPYGINMSLRLILDVSEYKVPSASKNLEEAIQSHYVERLLEWHPGLIRRGVIAGAKTVEGEAGLGLIETEEFWYEDVLEGRLAEEVASVMREKYTPEDGRGRRFVIVHIVLCTRPK